ncbi:MAG TPA: YfhO family protein, partial [Kofleriaceae bacterium]|nr:YfhO family protein [Kofleriaceae bacterium]
DPASLQRELFPVAPDQRGSLALGTVRLLGAGPPPPEPARRGPQPAPPCAIDSPRPERVELTCRSSTGGYAVLLDRDAPGWTAVVDGEPAAIVTADLLVRAVAVPRGLHRVSFLYQTPGLRLGALLSAAAWLNALALALLLRRLAQPRASVVPIEPG